MEKRQDLISRQAAIDAVMGLPNRIVGGRRNE